MEFRLHAGPDRWRPAPRLAGRGARRSPAAVGPAAPSRERLLQLSHDALIVSPDSRVDASIGLDPAKLGTHSLQRTKAVLIYRRTGNLRAVQPLLGHCKIESTVHTSESKWTMPARSLRRSTPDYRFTSTSGPSRR